VHAGRLRRARADTEALSDQVVGNRKELVSQVVYPFAVAELGVAASLLKTLGHERVKVYQDISPVARTFEASNDVLYAGGT